MTEDLIFKLSTISKTIQSALDFDRASKVKESIPVSGGSQITPPIWPTRYCLENWIEALDQACAELRDKQWQPIETAPRDGTIVRLKCDLHPEWSEQTMRWKNRRWEGMAFASIRPVDTWWDENVDQPTHWMPLPEPPK